MVFWATDFQRAPVDSRWVLKVAWTKGDKRQSGRPSRAVEWEEYRIREDGSTDFRYDESRSYRFFLDDASTPRDSLLSKGSPWPVRVYHDAGENPQTIITFAFPVEDAGEFKELARDQLFKADGEYTREVTAFNSDEHLAVGNLMQHMVDGWALLGLVDGGAMVDTTDEEPENWRFLIPDYADPYGPFRAIPPLGRFHWHHIFPDPKLDGVGRPWTSTSLRSAVLEGRAAVVTLGHILMLGGDFFAELDHMKVLEARKPVHAMSGFDNNDPLARLTLDGMLSKWAWSGKEAARWKMIGRPGGIPQDGDEERQRLQKQKEVQKDLGAIVEFVRKARGPTRMSEVHLLSRLVGSGKLVQPQTIDDACPWVRRGATSLLGKITASYILECIKTGWDVDFFHTVASNGHYLALARENYPHFSEHRENWNKFESYHRKALERIEAQSAYVMPLPADALALTAFGLHFMTDAFSAGHMRVPRRALGAEGGLAAKVMHDTDNILGLLVKDGFGDTWRAFGDDFLSPDRFASGTYSSLQKKIVESSTGGSAAAQFPRNLEKVTIAVASAFKQLFVFAVQKARKTKSRFAGLVIDGGVGHPGPARTDWYSRSIDQHLQYMSKHRPEPLPAGTADDGKSNHPPLYNPDLSINVKDDVYDTAGRKTLRLHWYRENFEQEFAKFYYLSVATRNEKGWVEPTEKKVIELFDKLSELFQEKLREGARDEMYPYGP